MQLDTKTNWSGPLYYYYRCAKNRKNGLSRCENYKNVSAPKTEREVWEDASGLFKDPAQLRADFERMIELEREGMRDRDREAKAWLEQLAKAERLP